LTIPSSLAMNNDLQYLTAVDPQRNIISKFQYLSWGEFTGSAIVMVESGQAWEMLFYQGKIVWSIDRQRPNRQWQRLLCAHVGYEHIELELLFQAANHDRSSADEVRQDPCWQYQGAIALLSLAEITPSQLTNILTTAALETIFDLLQYSQSEKLTFRSQPQAFANRPLILLRTEDMLDRAEAMWQEWDSQRLGNISPNKTPTIVHPVQLYRQTTPIIYQNLIQVITGKQTLREIAVAINEDLLLLTRSLTRYIQTGIIESIDLPDLPAPSIETKSAPALPAMVTPPSSVTILSNKLVICIDDSPQVCKLMRAIVTEAGHRFISIQDPTQALPRLLENNPDLIFLDLIMPKVNGYEICSQIKRISTLAHIPIVILTGKDGLLDRVRSKANGASEFISKPITRHAINTSLTKYIGTLVRG
jgi:two-component system, chemotaxis family, response regulator PixG